MSGLLTYQSLDPTGSPGTCKALVSLVVFVPKYIIIIYGKGRVIGLPALVRQESRFPMNPIGSALATILALFNLKGEVAKNVTIHYKA